MSLAWRAKRKEPRNYATFRKRVLENANYTCEWCGETNGLFAHHIIPVSEGGSHAVSNGLCLCGKCYLEEHRLMRDKEMLTGGNLVLRSVLAEMAQSAGLAITERTIRYWAMRGLIPRPTIVKRRACYQKEVLEKLQVIEALRPKTIEQIKQIMFESELFRHKLYQEGDVIVLRSIPRKKREK